MLKVLNRRGARKSAMRTSEADPGVLLRALEGIQTNASTGRLTLLTLMGHRAHLYAFEGEIYAVELEDYQPPVDRRLRSGALLDSTRLEALMALEPMGSPALRARMAAARDWVSIKDLGSIHHEFVLAAFGAALDAPAVSTSFSEGSATGEVCAIPAPIDVLVEAVAIRRARMQEDWSHVCESQFAEDCILRPAGSELPEDCQLPEFVAVHHALDGEKSLATVAFECGYTLAEAVHLVSGLVMRGLLVALDSAERSTAGMLVPETFPRYSGALALDVNAQHVTVEPTESAPTDPVLIDAAPIEAAALPAPGEADGSDIQDADHGRTNDVGTAFKEALQEELIRAESHVASIRAQLEQIGTVLADA